ncbi:MAG: DNA polymerase III subunit gamma/tau [bacterium]|nr:DNA polymerase III subunit gamma/tau [bacterium]
MRNGQMAYQALYRTYRPKTFSEVIGQDHVVRTLMNSVKQNKVGQAYLFSGPRGTGKTTVARLLARVINCESPDNGEPCGKCERCSGAEGVTGVLEIDAASHGSVDDMRQLVAQVSQIPLSGGMMVYIIDEVHMLSKEAFNAFLKTLEEPPPHAVFVLATTEPGKLLPTIHSRCQHFAFHRIPIAIVARHIKSICDIEGVPADEGALRLIARAGDGSIRDSISVLEQAIAYEPEGLTIQGVRDVLGIPDRMAIRELGGQIIAGDPGNVSRTFVDLVESGREPDSILKDMILHFRDLLFAVLNLDVKEHQELPDEERAAISKQVVGLEPRQIHETIAFLAKCEVDIKYEDEAALLVEISLLRLTAKFGKKEAFHQHVEESPIKATAPVKELEPEIRKFPEAGKKEPEETKPVERQGLTGGRTMKSRRRSESSGPDQAVPEVKQVDDKPKSVKSDSGLLVIPDGLEALWKDALETVREASIAEYILFAEAKPSPPPSEWPVVGSAPGESLQLTLKYPYNMGLLVKLLNEPDLHTELTNRLEEVLERPVTVRIARERGEDETESESDADGQKKNKQRSAGEPVSQTLFTGAAREVPTDPELRQIHNLIVSEFPDYQFEKEAGN